MANKCGFIHAETGQQRVGIGRQLLEAVLIAFGLGRGTKTNLVWHHNPITRRAKGLDAVLPRRAAEIFAMQ